MPEGRQLFVLAYCWKMQGGHSYLHLATHRGYQGVALAILNSSRGERLLHGRNHLGRTPLHVACANGEHYRNSRLVKAFIDAGAELDAVDHGGRTPLHWACMVSELAWPGLAWSDLVRARPPAILGTTSTVYPSTSPLSSLLALLLLPLSVWR